MIHTCVLTYLRTYTILCASHVIFGFVVMSLSWQSIIPSFTQIVHAYFRTCRLDWTSCLPTLLNVLVGYSHTQKGYRCVILHLENILLLQIPHSEFVSSFTSPSLANQLPTSAFAGAQYRE